MSKNKINYIIFSFVWALLIVILCLFQSLSKKATEINKANVKMFQGEMVILSEGGKYHRESCGYAKEAEEKMPLEEAEYSGFLPCRKCIK